MISTFSCSYLRMAHIKKINLQQPLLERVLSKMSSYSFLMKIFPGSNNMEMSHKIKNRVPYDSIILLWYISIGHKNITQKDICTTLFTSALSTLAMYMESI